MILQTHVYRKNGCPKCSNEAKSVYNRTIFERNKELANTPGRVYVIELTNGIETFYKVGITKNTVSNRFHCSGTPGYKRKTLFEKEMTLFEAFEIEENYKLNNKGSRYTPVNYFQGYTECFSEINWGYFK